MTFTEFVAVIRHRLAWVVLPFVALVALAGVASATTEPTYVAKARSFVSLPLGQSATDLSQGAIYTQQQIASFASLADEPVVLNSVIDNLGLDMSTRELSRNVSSAPAPDSAIIEISVTDTDPAEAAAIANAVNKELAAVVQRFSPTTDGQPLVKLLPIADAEQPTFPSSPKTKRNVLAGGLTGLLLGLLAALARDKLDTRLRSRDQLSPTTPLLASIENDRSFRVARTVGKPVTSKRAIIRDEALRKLRTNLRFLDVGEPVHVIVVTSGLPAEGKTSLSISLARVLAEDGRRVLIVDADMRRPKVATYLAVEGGIGLSDVLAGTVDLKDAVQSLHAGSLDLLASGSTPPNPSELLGSSSMSELIGKLRASYDHVVIDVPPLLPVTDASIVAAQSDGVVLVTRHGKTTLSDLQLSLTALAATESRVLGVVLNRVPTRLSRSQGYHHY